MIECESSGMRALTGPNTLILLAGSIPPTIVDRAFRQVAGRNAANLKNFSAATVIGAGNNEVSENRLADKDKVLCRDQGMQGGAGIRA